MKSDALADFIERKKAKLELGKIEVDGSFSGYASLFGTADLAGDTIESGAFEKSLAKRGASGVRMLYQHDPNEPIGIWTELKEDTRGLFVRGELTSGVWRAREVLSLMKSGALDGLSVGFRTLRARKNAGLGGRRIFEADLWEISIVTFPMLPEARVCNIKSRVTNKNDMLAIQMRIAANIFKKRMNNNEHAR